MKKTKKPKAATNDSPLNEISITIGPDGRFAIVNEPDDIKAFGAQQMKKDVRAELALLAKKAMDNDYAAASCLIELATFAATLVKGIEAYKPDISKRVAAGVTSWPVNITNTEGFPDDLMALRKRLNIGGEFPLGFNFQEPPSFRSLNKTREIVVFSILTLQAARASMRSFRAAKEMLAHESKLKEPDPNTGEVPASDQLYALLARQTAEDASRHGFKMADVAKGHRKTVEKLLETGPIYEDQIRNWKALVLKSMDLPELSLPNQGAWNGALRELLLILTSNSPEKNRVLYEIGKYRANKCEINSRRKIKKLDTAKKRAPVKEADPVKSKAANIKDGIFTQMKARLNALLKKPSAKA